MKPSKSQLRAERFVTKYKLAGGTYEQIIEIARAVSFENRSATVWFRKHVAGFCAQIERESHLSAQRAAQHEQRMQTLVEVEGLRLEKGRYGSKNKTAWRAWLPNGGHVLVYLNGRAGLTAQEAAIEALSKNHSGRY